MCAARELAYLRVRRSATRPDHFEWLAMLGAGAFAQVFLCRHISTGLLAAVKKIAKCSIDSTVKSIRLRTERAVLGATKNPWLTKLYFAFENKDYYFLAMEFVPGGDFGCLLRNIGTLEENVAVFYLAQMVCAVHSLHRLGFIHRDVKPSNFLIDAKGRLKLGDFGLSKGNIDSPPFATPQINPSETLSPPTQQSSSSSSPLPSATQLQSEFPMRMDQLDYTVDPSSLESSFANSSSNTGKGNIREGGTPDGERKPQTAFPMAAASAVGTAEYAAVEVVRDPVYDETVDWWSVGCILYEMLYGRPPFHSMTEKAVLENVKHFAERLVRPTQTTDGEPLEISDEAWDLITQFAYILLFTH